MKQRKLAEELAEQVQSMWVITSIAAQHLSNMCYDVFDAVDESKYNYHATKRLNNTLESNLVKMNAFIKDSLQYDKSKICFYADASIAMQKTLKSSEEHVRKTFHGFLLESGCSEIELITQIYTTYFMIISCQKAYFTKVDELRKLTNKLSGFGAIWNAYEMLEVLQRNVAKLNGAISKQVTYEKLPDAPNLTPLAFEVIGTLQSGELWQKILSK